MLCSMAWKRRSFCQPGSWLLGRRLPVAVHHPPPRPRQDLVPHCLAAADCKPPVSVHLLWASGLPDSKVGSEAQPHTTP